jgi:glyoxylase-like metal-dependent hydrolase (beta-lactamase superfamily II)
MEERLIPELKSKRLISTPEGDHADIVAWLRALRAWNKTRKIYEINPYVEVYQFRDNMYGLFSYNCDAAGDPWMYLVIGPEKAILLDTAFGLGDTKALVDILTGGKPLIVVNTHGHPDHAFGNCRFDTVYCHEYSVWELERQDEHLWDYLFDEKGNNRWLAFDKKDLPVFKKYKIIGVPDGYLFNLGGDYDIELKWVPGHASGHSMFLDKKGRILFAGDGLCAHISGEGSGKKPGDPYWQYNNIEDYRRELVKLRDRKDEFDSIFPFHFINDLPNILLDEVIKACDAVLSGPESYDYKADYKTGDGRVLIRMYKYIWGFGVLGFQEGGLYHSDKG